MASKLSTTTDLLSTQENISQIRQQKAASVGAGVVNDDTQRVVAASDSPEVAAGEAIQTAVGSTSDAAVDDDSVGTLNAHLRGLTKLIGLVTDQVNESLETTETTPAELYQSKNTGIIQLTAPGETAEEAVTLYSVYGYTLTVASIDTNVVVRLEGSIDQSNYGVLPLDNTAVPNAAITENQVTITANGTYVIYSSAPVVDVRLDFVSEAGGTNATIDADFFARRQ